MSASPSRCEHCGAELMPAMIRCRRCNSRRSASEPATSPAHRESQRSRTAPQNLKVHRELDGSSALDDGLERQARELELLTADVHPTPLATPPARRASEHAPAATIASTIVRRVPSDEDRSSTADDVPSDSGLKSSQPAPHFNLAADSAAELLSKRAAQDDDEADDPPAPPPRLWTWRDLIPDVIYGLASDRTLAIVAAAIVVVGVIAGGVWWGPFGNADTTDPGMFIRPSNVRGFTASLAFAGDGTLAAGRTLGQVETWNTGTGERIESLDTIRGSYVALSPDGSLLLAGDEQQSRGLSLQTGTIILRDRGIRSLAVNMAGTHAVSLDTEGNALVWNLVSARVGAVLPLTRGRDITAIAVGPEGRQCAVGTRTGAILLIDVDSVRVVGEIVINRSGAITALAIGPVADQVAAITADNRLHVFDGQLHDKDWGDPVAPGNQFMSKVRWLAEDRILTTGGRTLAICTPQSEPQTWVANIHSIDALATSPDGGLAAVGSRDESAIVVFDLASRQPLRTLDVQGD